MTYAIFKNNRIEGGYERPDKNAKIKNICSIEWEDNLNSVFNSFSFTTTEKLECGQIIELVEANNGKTVLRGSILEITKNKKGVYTYRGYDCGGYLEKNSTIIQYTEQDITNAIIRVCKEINILVSSDIVNIETKVKKIYHNKTLTNIILDLLKIAKDKNPNYSDLYVDCSSGYFNIKKYTENNNLKACMANLYRANSFDLITEFEVKTSIENLKNKILIAKNKNSSEKMKELDFVNDEKSISHYGLFQQILEVDNDNKQDYKKIAYNKLQELNKPDETIKLTFLGDYNAHKGVITSINNPELGLTGKYLILNTKHVINGSKEIVEANLRFKQFL